MRKKYGKMGAIILSLVIVMGAINAVAKADKVNWKIWEGKININEASQAELSMLKGIGKITAHRIIEYRDRVGGFKSVSQLKEVKGVSKKMLENLMDHLTLFEKSNLKVLVDINRAPVRAFKALPGISKKIAISLVEYRDRNEGFDRLEDMLEVEGMNLAKYDELKAFISFRAYDMNSEKK